MEPRDAALSVWRAARADAGGEPPAPRVARVRAKLSDPEAVLVVVERAGDVVGMALAEPFREGGGTGEVRPRWGHVSMVFVHPGHQGAGVGRVLVGRLLHDAPRLHLSVWTRTANVRAQRLYAACGFVATDDQGSTSGGEPVRRWERVAPHGR